MSRYESQLKDSWHSTTDWSILTLYHEFLEDNGCPFPDGSSLMKFPMIATVYTIWPNWLCLKVYAFPSEIHWKDINSLFSFIFPHSPEKTIPGYPPAARKEIARLLGHLPMIREVQP